jgi:hypothetical protein
MYEKKMNKNQIDIFDKEPNLPGRTVKIIK